MIGEGEQKERRAKKARRQMPIAGLDIFDKLVDQHWLQRWRSHLRVQRDHIGSLRARSNFSIVLDICLLKCPANALYQILVSFRVGLFAGGVCHLRHHVSDQSPVRSRQQILIGMFVRR